MRRWASSTRRCSVFWRCTSGPQDLQNRVSYRRDPSLASIVCSHAITSVLQRITKGHLRIVTPNRTYDFPSARDDAEIPANMKVELRVLSDTFWLRLATMNDVGFAEAYMFGDVECSNLVSLFRVGLILNFTSAH
jgi:hypothetical protein